MKAADQGIAQAQYNLGGMCLLGRGVDQNVAKASGWFLKAAKKNQQEAQHHLAGMYVEGKGVEQDLVEAEKWLRMAMKGADREVARNPQLITGKISRSRKAKVVERIEDVGRIRAYALRESTRLT